MTAQNFFTRPAFTRPTHTRRAALIAGAAGVVLAMSACAGSGTGTAAGGSAGADPIKKLGEYDVPLKLHRDVITPLKVKVVAEGQK